jgi:hypothetical protein
MENQTVNPFDEESWSDAPVKNEENLSADADGAQQNQEQAEAEESQAQEVIQEPQREVHYENEVSEQIHKALSEGKYDDVYKYLERNNKLEKLTTGEITNRDVAEDVVKEAMRLKYSDLSEDEISYKFNRQFKLPKEPVQGLAETDDEFSERMEEFKQKVQEINTELMIEAKTVRPELAKHKQEIKLPSLGNRPKSPEELASQEAYLESFLNSAESSLNEFNGINVDYQDDGLSLTSSYTPSVEEKQAIAQMMDDLVDSEFDANALFADRWVNDDYSLNSKQIAEDLWFFQNRDKIIQKLVNDAVSKRINEYRKQTSNISVSGGNKADFAPSGGKSDMDQMAEHFFSN